MVDLELPNTLLRGKVIVAATGAPVPRSIVTAVSAGEIQESSVQVIADQEGRFELHGLLPGPALIEASGGREDLYADPVLADVRPQEESQPIVLRAGPRLKISGTVISSAAPVPGARVKAVPVGIPIISSRVHTADSQGRFTLFLPSATRQMQVTVGAPGFALRLQRLPIPENREIVLGLEQASGTLILELDRPLDYVDPNAAAVVLLHNGAFEWLSYLQTWAAVSGIQRQGEDGKWVVPAMEPGAYQAWLDLPRGAVWSRLRYHTFEPLRQRVSILERRAQPRSIGETQAGRELSEGLQFSDVEAIDTGAVPAISRNPAAIQIKTIGAGEGIGSEVRTPK